MAFVYGDGEGHLQGAPGLLGTWNWHPAAVLSLVHHRDIATAMLLGLDGAFDGRTVKSSVLLENPWNGHVDGSLARQLGFVPARIYA